MKSMLIRPLLAAAAAIAIGAPSLSIVAAPSDGPPDATALRHVPSATAGRIVGIEPIRARPKGSGAGAVAGGVVGGVLGNQVFGGTAATVIGAAAAPSSATTSSAIIGPRSPAIGSRFGSTMGARAPSPNPRSAAFVSATGSASTGGAFNGNERVLHGERDAGSGRSRRLDFRSMARQLLSEGAATAP
jgi:hypothetical protein